jgi:uncharacterized membrane protein
MPRRLSLATAYWGAVASLLALIFLCLFWELVWAPIAPGGSWLALKALPLLAPLRGILHGRLYTYRWTPLLALAYFAEGVVRAWSEAGIPALLAGIEIALSLMLFASAIAFVRSSRTTQF